MNKLKVQFPNSIKKGKEGVPDEIVIDSFGYCGPYVASLYASLKLSEAISANCLLNAQDYNYLKYKYGLSASLVAKQSTINTMNEVFSLYLPDELVFHDYALTQDDLCGKCQNDSKCSSEYLNKIGKNAEKLLSWRNYDEIHRAKEELEKIIQKKDELGEEIISDDVKREFLEKQNIINRNIKKVFPVIKRWTCLSAIIAAPIPIISAIAGQPIATTIAAASIISASTIVSKTIELYENKHKWVGFINNLQNSK